MSKEYSPRDHILHMLNLWWVIAITMILGGFIGYAVHRIRPPIFQAKAILSTFIDYQDITDVQLTQYDEDITINSVQAVMFSNDVIESVLTQAAANDIFIDYSSFIRQVSINRTLADYELFFRDHNPYVAQQIVNLWANSGLSYINQLQSDGALPLYLTVNLGSLADLPKKPAYSQTNSYVLSGSIIGLMIGIILTSTPYPPNLIKTPIRNKKNRGR